MEDGVIGLAGQLVMWVVEEDTKKERGVVQILLHRGEEINVGEEMRKSGNAILMHVQVCPSHLSAFVYNYILFNDDA